MVIMVIILISNSNDGIKNSNNNRIVVIILEIIEAIGSLPASLSLALALAVFRGFASLTGGCLRPPGRRA